MPKALTLEHTDILPDLIKPLLTWYRRQANDRQLPWRLEPTPYHTWLSEIMLQQTRAATVIPYYERFLTALPDIAALAAVSDDTLMKLWQGLGYYSRARNLKKAAKVITAEYGGELPQEHKALLALPGIGRYTAGAIGSIAWGKPWPAVDGNVLRVITRVLACPEDIMAARTRTAIETALAPHYPSGTDASDLNQAFMDLGATICLPHGAPHCTNCPLKRLCLAHDTGHEQDFPVKTAAKSRRIEQHTILLLQQGDAFALQKRPATGLLAGLWEFPHLPRHQSQSDIETWLQQHDYQAVQIEPLPESKHIFSHVEWHMTGWKITLSDNNAKIAESCQTFQWVSPAQIAATYSIPSAFSYYFPYLK
ncbi:A/G-specific DNA-adenine glycosylase [Selenomonas sp. GACV-9]|uniref:A/G-specific adenine glycosylase n=1 Tax=Selenomonas sp. GACV-9 TaxID=3158782 RepID=UPI0008E297F6|nr:A/G-specific DNA-adenine glycosylase [Selenomonas ruminantium]